MIFSKVLSVLTAVFVLGGCANKKCIPDVGVVLQGTNTAVVGLYLDENKNPQAVFEDVIVAPGQKIVFVGPDNFDILFKDQKSPIGELEIKSSRGIVVIEIPKDVFEKEQRASKSTTMKKELVYRYGIRVAGRVTDPSIRIRPQ